MTIVYQGINQFLNWWMWLVIILIGFYVLRLGFALLGSGDSKGGKSLEDWKKFFDIFKTDKKQKKASKEVDSQHKDLGNVLASIREAAGIDNVGEAKEWIERAKRFMKQLVDSDAIERLAEGTPFVDDAKYIRSKSAKILKQLQSMKLTKSNLQKVNQWLGAIDKAVEDLKKNIAEYEEAKNK